jgi:hypothetical protein
MSRKGSQFEREISRALSEWWVPGRDDIFWRTHGSGARATTRAKRGKQTAGQHGDICASDPAGADLMRLFVFSLKTGYSGDTIHDIFDDPETQTSRASAWGVWIYEARESAELAGVPYWAVISKRKARDPIIVLPRAFRKKIQFDRGHEVIMPHVGEVSIRKLSWFFKWSPKVIKALCK